MYWRRLLTPLAPLATALCLSTLVSAQTTHTVTLAGVSFTPPDLKIDVGDTVQWVWQSGLHNVVSGTGGLADGAFFSGNPTIAPNSFSVLFDQAFLNANSRVANLYAYFCAPHVSFGMVGSVQVRTPATSTVRNGSGSNPLGFAEVAPAVIGGVWSTTVDIVTPGALASAVVVSAVGPLQLPTGLGELLIDPSVLAGPVNIAVGAHAIPIPPDCGLIGLRLATQAATYRPGQIRLQNALDIVLGS